MSYVKFLKHGKSYWIDKAHGRKIEILGRNHSMKSKAFSISEALTYGFKEGWKNSGFLVYTYFIALFVVLMAFIIAHATFAWIAAFFIYKGVNSTLLIFIGILSLFFFIYTIGLGYVKLVFDFYDGKERSVKALFSCVWLVPKFLVIVVLYRLILSIGLSLFFIPGLFVLARGGFYIYYLVDQNAGIIDSLKKSFVLTKGYTWQLIVITTVLEVMRIATCFLATPFVELSYIFMYRKLNEHKQQSF